MASFSASTPPPFDRNRDNYQKWKKKITVWRLITEIEKKKQGGLIALSIDDDTQDTILEAVSSEDLAKDTGADTVIRKLDEMFMLDPTIVAYEHYREFSLYKRPDNMSIQDHINRFEKLWNRTRSSGATISDDVLAYHLLKTSQLCEYEEMLVKATLENITFSSMKSKLKRIFGSSVKSSVSSLNRSKEHLQTVSHTTSRYHAHKYVEEPFVDLTHVCSETVDSIFEVKSSNQISVNQSSKLAEVKTDDTWCVETYHSNTVPVDHPSDYSDCRSNSVSSTVITPIIGGHETKKNKHTELHTQNCTHNSVSQTDREIIQSRRVKWKKRKRKVRSKDISKENTRLHQVRGEKWKKRKRKVRSKEMWKVQEICRSFQGRREKWKKRKRKVRSKDIWKFQEVSPPQSGLESKESKDTQRITTNYQKHKGAHNEIVKCQLMDIKLVSSGLSSFILLLLYMFLVHPVLVTS